MPQLAPINVKRSGDGEGDVRAACTVDATKPAVLRFDCGDYDFVCIHLAPIQDADLTNLSVGVREGNFAAGQGADGEAFTTPVSLTGSAPLANVTMTGRYLTLMHDVVGTSGRVEYCVFARKLLR